MLAIHQPPERSGYARGSARRYRWRRWRPDSLVANSGYQMATQATNGLLGYAWPRCVRSGEVSEFRVHSVEPYHLEMWRHGWQKDLVQGLGPALLFLAPGLALLEPPQPTARDRQQPVAEPAPFRVVLEGPDRPGESTAAAGARAVQPGTRYTA